MLSNCLRIDDFSVLDWTSKEPHCAACRCRGKDGQDYLFHVDGVLPCLRHARTLIGSKLYFYNVCPYIKGGSLKEFLAKRTFLSVPEGKRISIDVASPYIHGGQTKIADIFAKARDNPPTILFFDEIGAMVRKRELQNTTSETGEVNEFFAQLNNCGESGIIAIGATNQPDLIDEAVLRASRLEYKYYIPKPDYETRRLLFIQHLKKRRCATHIDFYVLASKTKNYIAADIKLIIDKVARTVFRSGEDKITQSVLETEITKSKPSLSEQVLARFEQIQKLMQTI